MIKKIIIFSLLGFLLYKGTQFYMVYRMANQVSACGDLSVVEDMEKNKTPTPERLKYSAKVWACVKEQQNFVDALFFKIPESWLNPPSQP